MVAKFTVCPSCKGEGSLTPGFVYTQDDVDEQFGADLQEFREHMADLRNGLYNEPCDWCKGKRVVLAVDESGVSAERQWAEELDYRAMCAAERRFGC